MKATKYAISTNYTAQEVFAIFVEEHRLASPLDLIADENYVLKPETTVEYWRAARDLVEWDELAVFFNQYFGVAIPFNEWHECFEPEDERTITDVCRLIASYAIKEKVMPKQILGANCLTASVFLNLKGRLEAKGVDTSELRPSSRVAPYLEKYFSPMLEEILLTGVYVFDTIEYSRSWKQNQNPTWFEKLFAPKLMIKLVTGNMITFRDVVNRICENRQLLT